MLGMEGSLPRRRHKDRQFRCVIHHKAEGVSSPQQTIVAVPDGLPTAEELSRLTTRLSRTAREDNLFMAEAVLRIGSCRGESEWLPLQLQLQSRRSFPSTAL